MRLSSKKKIAILCVTVIFLSVFAYRTYAVNKNAYHKVVYKYSMNETVLYENCEYTVTDMEMIKTDEGRRILVHLHVSNPTDEEQETGFYLFKLESGGFNQGMSLMSYEEYNDGSDMGVLKPGEEQDVVIPYNVRKYAFKKRYWKNIDEREWFLVFRVKPDKVEVDLRD